ncbi:hypothetical protein CRX72_20510 [Pantoea sp. BRM17]|nr:hypothetical protein CRX72_20510 [Pantoea sp. BRM17]
MRDLVTAVNHRDSSALARMAGDVPQPADLQVDVQQGADCRSACPAARLARLVKRHQTAALGPAGYAPRYL